MTSRSLSRRQARWSEYLARFNFYIEHVPGIKNKADGLSRRPDHIPTITDNDNTVLLPSKLFINAIITLSAPPFLQRLHHKDPLPEWIQTKVSDSNSGWTTVNGLVRDAGDRIVVPEDVSLRTEIIRLTHDTPYAGHPGIEKTQELVRRNYFWNSVNTDVSNYVRTCPTCQQTKVYPSKPHGRLQPIPPSSIPWEEITADLIVALPESNGYDSILVVVDRFTKRSHFIATTSRLAAEGEAQLFYREIWKHHGYPKKIITDRGAQFAAKYTVELNRLLGIQTALSTAYHPQTDGQTERVNQELELYLRLYTNYMQNDWYDWLPSAEFAYNNRIHSSTKHTPFFLEYGRHPLIPHMIPNPSKNPAAQDFIAALAIAHEKAKIALEQTTKRMQHSTDKKRRPTPLFQTGDLVYLDTRNIKTGRPSKKLDVKRTGPFEVLEQINPVAYRIRLPPSWKLHPVFHVSLLRLAHIDEKLHPDPIRDDLRPPPDIIDNEEEYEVEKIIDHRGGIRRRQYLVKWRGYPISEATWEPKNLLRHAPDAIHAYEEMIMN
jgi:hypothetical protein